MAVSSQAAMDSVRIIAEFYDPGSLAYELLLSHGRHVAQKAIQTAEKVPHLKPDSEFIIEAAMLHDIGIFLTDTPALGCAGKYPYVCHGYLGRNILENKGLPRHALVCERHVGVGISVEDIQRQGLPLPRRDMQPVTIEEQIICYADKFFSKLPGRFQKEFSIEEILNYLMQYGEEPVARFQEWVQLFNGTNYHVHGRIEK